MCFTGYFILRQEEEPFQTETFYCSVIQPQRLPRSTHKMSMSNVAILAIGITDL